MTEWLMRLGVALRKVFVADPVEPLPDEFVRLCEELDAAGLPPAPDLTSPGLPRPQS